MDILFNELPIIFPFYEKKEMQDKNNENVKTTCVNELISPSNAVLPFQIRLPLEETQKPLKWEVFKDCGGISIDLSNNLDKISGYSLENGFYIQYKGEALTAYGKELDLKTGNYYVKLTFEDFEYYSEVFNIPLNRFKVEEENIPYLKIEYSNTGDIDPIIYKGGFTNVVYLDTFIHKSEPEIQEDGERDGQDELTPTFQKLVIKYNFTVLVPNFLKIALVSLQMHDLIKITTPNNIRSGLISGCNVSFIDEDNGALSTVDVKFTQYVLTKNSCAENISFYEVENMQPVLEVATIENNNVFLKGNIPLGSWANIYKGSNKIKSNITRSAIANGINLGNTGAGSYKIESENYNSNHGFSNSITV